MTSTIYALTSPFGKSGIAVIRLSGQHVQNVIKRLCLIKEIKPRYAHYCTFIDPESQNIVDQGLVLFFPHPHSFTGEDVAEFQLHGSPAVIRHMLSVLAQQPHCRLAQPGEFTRRAFEQGKLDLTEAEAIADLIHAETLLQKEQAITQLGGGLSQIYKDWTERLKNILAHLEADLEFPDEDLPEGVTPQGIAMIQSLSTEISDHLNDDRRGERLRDGIRIAVIGAPNTGKSSLVNALAQRDVAIVSEHAGTTRDVIEVHLDVGGYPVILSDTAGLRPDQLGNQGQDSIESEGIRRALERAQQADIRLLLFDAAALPAHDSHTQALINDSALIIYNKLDQYQGAPRSDYLMISVQNNQGIDRLLAALTHKIEQLIGTRTTPSLTRARHRESLSFCHSALERALGASLPELMAEDTRLAIRALGQITGHVDVEDLLDVIFRDFCIGK